MSKPVRIIICGFGRVGRNFARLLDEKKEYLARAFGFSSLLLGVGELGGSVYSPDGLDAAALAEFFEKSGTLNTAAGLRQTDWQPDWQGIDLIHRAAADVLVETTPTDIHTGEPALSHIRAALEGKMHVVSANKGPFIRHYPALREKAAAAGLALKLSAAAAAALPTLDVAQTCLAGTEIRAIEGILNGTSNFILSRMRSQGVSYADALAEAQRLGIAEADPALDVEGHDTANKLALIANVCMGLDIAPEDVPKEGIQGVSPEDIQAATAGGRVIRLIGKVERTKDGGFQASVRPEALAPDHPLAGVDGAEKGIAYTTDTMDRVAVIGGKSDPRGAAAAILKDILNIYRDF
ncbi:MAG: homoserine dehydrogenase [bacterium]|nr:homoserine dehydrogenase [bacterium]